MLEYITHETVLRMYQKNIDRVVKPPFLAMLIGFTLSIPLDPYQPLTSSIVLGDYFHHLFRFHISVMVT